MDHYGLVWGGLPPEPSLYYHPNNVIIPLDFTQLFCPCFTLVAGPPSGFTTDIVGCWGGALSRACNLTVYTVSLVHRVNPLLPAMEDPGSISRGELLWNQDSSVSIVSLQIITLLPLLFNRDSSLNASSLLLFKITLSTSGNHRLWRHSAKNSVGSPLSADEIEWVDFIEGQ
jgi:hypothetical protein